MMTILTRGDLLLLSLCVSCVAGIKYELHQEASTWHDARDTCEQDDKRLVHVLEKMEHTRIQQYRPYIFHHFWIGLKDEGSGSFKWTDDSVAEFTAWGQGQPNSQSECVRYNTDDFTWQTHNCSDLLFFMCENSHVPRPKMSDSQTAMMGLLAGFGSMLGLLFLGIILVQMPCCRSGTVMVIGHFGLGRR